MRLAWTGIGALAGFLFCASLICNSQNSSSIAPSDCKRSIKKAEFEGFKDGPFVTQIGYSKALHSCVVIRVQGFPYRSKLIVEDTDIFDITAKRTIWEDSRKLPRGTAKEPRYPALEEQLKKFEIELDTREGK